MITPTNHTTMEMAISKMGERGQIVIPQEFREQLHIKKGEKFVVVSTGDKIILQQMKKMKAKTLERMYEDMVDLKLADEAMEEIKRGEYKSYTAEEYLKKMEKWANE